MNERAANLVEIPRWVKLLNGAPFGGPRPSRRDILLVEAFVVGLAIGLFVASFFVTTEAVAKILRAGAAFELVVGYLVSWLVRLKDTYQMWPGLPGASPDRPRTWRSKVAEYSFFFGVSFLFVAIVCWVAI